MGFDIVGTFRIAASAIDLHSWKKELQPFGGAGQDHLNGYGGDDQPGDPDQWASHMDAQQHPVDWQGGNHQQEIRQDCQKHDQQGMRLPIFAGQC